MKVISKVEFTPEEKKAISIISNIECDGIQCVGCPFNTAPTIPCVKTLVKDVVAKAEIKPLL